MLELIIAITVFIAAVYLWKRKKTSCCAAKKATPEQSKPAEKVVPPSEQAVVQQTGAKPVVASVATTVASQTVEPCHKNLPEDSMLRRHYLTHVRTMLSVVSAQSTDATFSVQLERCLNDAQAMQQLLADYAQSKKIVATPAASAPQVQHPAPETIEAVEPIIVEPKASTHCQCQHRLPEDSLLRRHYLTELHAQVAATLPARPTDSTLRRHYDSLLENTVQQLLN